MAAGYRVLLAGTLALLLFVVFGEGVMIGGALGSAPQEQSKPASQQQAKEARDPSSIEQQPPGGGGQQGGCPGTKRPDLSCEALTAEATLEQTDAARQNNWLSLGTAFVAGLAAWFAKRAADAASQNLAHDKRVSRAQLRPWISQSGVNFNPFTNGWIDGVLHTHGFVASVSFLNTGVSPALNVRFFGDYRLGSMDPAEAAPHFEMMTPGPDDLPGCMGPQRGGHTADCPIGPADADNFRSHSASVWLYGRAEYEEPGHEGPPYVTEVTFRIFYGGELQGPNGQMQPRITSLIAGPQNTMT